MAWVATAIIGTAVVGGVSAYAGGKAQADAAESASQATYAQYMQTREDQEPWRIAGEKALQVIQDTPDFEFTAENFNQFKDPSYDFRMTEGVNALDRSAASRGRLLSGAQDRAVTRYGSDLASQEYGNAFNRSLTEYNVNLAKQQGLAGVGQSATNVVSSAGQQASAQQAQITQNAAQAQAQTYSGFAQSANQGIGNYLLANKAGLL